MGPPALLNRSPRLPWLLMCLLVLLISPRHIGVQGSLHDRRMRLHRRTTTPQQDIAFVLQGLSAQNHAAAPVDVSSAQAVAATSISPCPSWQFEWPAGKGYCWYKRTSNGAKQGPGNNVFDPNNVVVNAAGQLVLTIKYTKSPGSCAEVWANRSYGYGDYVVETATDPTTIDYRLVASPFLYANDTMEYDMEYSRWSVVNNANSQYVVQPYTTNAPLRFQVTSVNVTHRIRWTPQSVVFESFLPNRQGGQLVNTWTYTGPYNFVPGQEAMHFNHWIYTKASTLPATSTFVVNCFAFCAQSQLATCSTPLGTKPSC